MSGTLGQRRVGIGFNPSGNERVAQIKADAAALIDLIDAIPLPPAETLCTEYAEIRRLKALAQTAIEEAAMWAVKAATKG